MGLYLWRNSTQTILTNTIPDMITIAILNLTMILMRMISSTKEKSIFQSQVSIGLTQKTIDITAVVGNLLIGTASLYA